MNQQIETIRRNVLHDFGQASAGIHEQAVDVKRIEAQLNSAIMGSHDAMTKSLAQALPPQPAPTYLDIERLVHDTLVYHDNG